MAAILKQHLDRLRDTGLLVSDPFVANHVAFPDGVMVAKPASVKGNSLPDFECSWGGCKLDAPSLSLHSGGARWFVTSHDFIPGPGPGDFVNEWATAEEAVADVLDFYFGNPARMDVKRRARE